MNRLAAEGLVAPETERRRRRPAVAALAPHRRRPGQVPGHPCGTDPAADRRGASRARRGGAGPSDPGARGQTCRPIAKPWPAPTRSRKAGAAGGTSLARGLHGGVAGGCRWVRAAGKPLSDLRRSDRVPGILPCRTRCVPRVAGPGVSVERTDHILAGARRCAYRIVPIAPILRRHSMAWIDALSLDELAAKGKAVVRHAGRQILLLHTGRGVFACANRCPDEGYPLSEGTLGDGCVLTCNWHNWKFDLAAGVTLVGGDALPRYPVRSRPVASRWTSRRLIRQNAGRRRSGAWPRRWRTSTSSAWFARPHDWCAWGGPGGGGRGRGRLGGGAAGVRHHACHRRRSGLAAPVRATRHQRRHQRVAAVGKSSGTSPTMRVPAELPFPARRGVLARGRIPRGDRDRRRAGGVACCVVRSPPAARWTICCRRWSPPR